LRAENENDTMGNNSFNLECVYSKLFIERVDRASRGLEIVAKIFDFVKLVEHKQTERMRQIITMTFAYRSRCC
jgi:hypothetical protein